MKNPTLLVFVLALVSACASQQASKQSKLAEISYSYGTQALMTKDYTGAITHLLKAAELDPKNPEVHNNLGMAYYFKGEKQAAKTHVQKALDLDEKNTDARSNLASLLFEEGDLAGAERIYLQCLKDLTYEKQARIYLNLGLIELRRGNTPKATAYMQRSVKEDENYCPAWFQLGQISFKQKNFKQAQTNFKNAGMGACAEDPAAWYWQALTLIESREYLNARIKLDELTTRFPSSAYAAMAKEKLSALTLLEQRHYSETVTSPSQETSTPSF